MRLTTEEIAQLVGGRLNGSKSVIIEGVAGLEEAGLTDLSFVKDGKNASTKDLLATTKAGAVLVPSGMGANGHTSIEVENPLAAFAKILQVLAGEKRPMSSGVSNLAQVSPKAKIGAGVYIGAFTIVEDDAEISDGAKIYGQAYIGRRSKVGKNSILYPQVVLREDVSLGERCIVHAGSIIGSDGYGFFFANGKHNKIEQVGSVIIEDDVEIGSCTTIDRATTGATIIRKGTKIDNLVQIAHNVEVGAHSLLVAQVGIGGSSKLGVGVVLAGQVGVADHVKIGDGAQVGAQSGIKDDIEPKAVMFGSPAQPIQDTIRQTLLIRRLPEIFKDVKKLKETQS